MCNLPFSGKYLPNNLVRLAKYESKFNFLRNKAVLIAVATLVFISVGLFFNFSITFFRPTTKRRKS